MNDNESQRLVKELMPSFLELTKKITNLYCAVGHTRPCGRVDGLWYPVEPGLGIDFVPEAVRRTLEDLIEDAGINLKKSDGDRGKDAYFRLLADGLTAEKLQKLSEGVDAETQRLQSMRGSSRVC